MAGNSHTMRTSERGGGADWRGGGLGKLTLEGTLSAARGPRLQALQLPGLCERAFGLRAAASGEGRGEHPLLALFVGGAGRGGGGACYFDRVTLPSVILSHLYITTGKTIHSLD